MLTVGLDVHFNKSSMCVLDENGKAVKQRQIKGHQWQKRWWRGVAIEAQGAVPGLLRGVAGLRVSVRSDRQTPERQEAFGGASGSSAIDLPQQEQE